MIKTPKTPGNPVDEFKKGIMQAIAEKMNFKNGLLTLAVAIVLKMAQIVYDFDVTANLSIWSGTIFNFCFLGVVLIAVAILFLFVFKYELKLEDLKDIIETDKSVRRPQRLEAMMKQMQLDLKSELKKGVELIEAVTGSEIHVPPVSVEQISGTGAQAPKEHKAEKPLNAPR